MQNAVIGNDLIQWIPEFLKLPSKLLFYFSNFLQNLQLQTKISRTMSFNHTGAIMHLFKLNITSIQYYDLPIYTIACSIAIIILCLLLMCSCCFIAYILYGKHYPPNYHNMGDPPSGADEYPDYGSKEIVDRGSAPDM